MKKLYLLFLPISFSNIVKAEGQEKTASTSQIEIESKLPNTINDITIEYQPGKQFIHSGPTQKIATLKPGQRISIPHKTPKDNQDHVITGILLPGNERLAHYSFPSSEHWSFRDHKTLRNAPDDKVKLLMLQEDPTHNRRYLEAIK